MSLFGKVPPEKPPPAAYARERIESEIEHLKKKKSVRHSAEERRAWTTLIVTLVLLFFFGLYAMDPFVHAWRKGDAIEAYLYIHHFGRDAKAQELINSRILSSSEAEALNHRSGSFEGYFSNPQAAEQKVDVIVEYMDSVRNLHEGKYDDLSWLNKIRYNLFYTIGVGTPIDWPFLDPKADSD